jgi:hypothetical protein
MPNAIESIIRTRRPHWLTDKTVGAASPGIYVPPTFDLDDDDSSTDVNQYKRLSATQIRDLQRDLGAAQYLGMAIMPSIQTACGEIASEINIATEYTQRKMDRTLRYMAAFPNPRRTYHASDMVMHIQSDSSHDSRPGSKDVVGGIFYMGFKNNAYKINAPFATISKQLQWIVNSAGESEYSGLFYNGQLGYNFRETLEDLGFPQKDPTIILCDNSTAIGLAHKHVKPKKSKFFNRRWNWIQQAVDEKLFIIKKIAGKVNLADFSE